MTSRDVSAPAAAGAGAPARVVGGVVLSAAAADAVDVRPDELIRRWLDAKSPTVRRSYARSLARFAAWAIDGQANPADAMRLLCDAGSGAAHELLSRWRDVLLESLAPGTVAGCVTALASLLQACRRAGLINWTIEGVAPPAEPVQDRSGPRRRDVERLVAHLDDVAGEGDPRALRDAVLVRLLFCCALRRSEAVGLRIRDVLLEHPGGAAVNPRRKGRRARELVLVSEGTATTLRAWLSVRSAADPDAWVFTRNDRGSAASAGPLTGESVRRMLRCRAREAGVRATIRPHGLRHSAATETAAKGSLSMLMALGSWKSLSAAQSYLDRRQDERRAALRLVDL